MVFYSIYTHTSTHFISKSNNKKENLIKFVRSIVVLKQKSKLNFRSFVIPISTSDLFVQEERFIIDRNVINLFPKNEQLFYYNKDSIEAFYEHLQLHIIILYYKEYLNLSYNQIPEIFGKKKTKNIEKKIYLDRIAEIIRLGKIDLFNLKILPLL